MLKTDFLRKRHPQFIYHSYFFEVKDKNLEILFDFRILPDFCFKHKFVIKNISQGSLKKLGEGVLNNLVFNLGLAEMISYWKATCSPEIIIEAGSLNQGQIKWWQDLILRGMGQFLFENKINFRAPDFLKIKSKNEKPWFHASNRRFSERFLVPLGGGKDSLVAWELLKGAGKGINGFSLNCNRIVKKVMKAAGGKAPIVVGRQIDKKLLELNRQGFLNGHVPFSAQLAFLTVLSAAIFDYKYIAIANERSSNEGNVKYLGKEINHQYSKSFDFEEKFRKYSKKYLAPDIEYFSLLRPLYELQIAKIFSQYSKYFPVFMSCNQPFKMKPKVVSWCGQCPKCLFVFASLYPFLGEKKVVKIFGKNLFEKKELLPLMQELIGERGFKPFECVGTQKESLAAFYLSHAVSRRPVPALLKYFEKRVLPRHKNLEKMAKSILNSWNLRHNLSSELEKILHDRI